MSYFNSFDSVSNFITRLEQYGIKTPSEIVGIQEAVRATPLLRDDQAQLSEQFRAAIETGRVDLVHEIAPLLDAIGSATTSTAYDSSRTIGLSALIQRYPWNDALLRVADDFDAAAARLVATLGAIDPDSDPMTLSADTLEPWRSVAPLTARLDATYDLLVTIYQHREQKSWALFGRSGNVAEEVDLCVRRGAEKLTPQRWKSWSDPQVHLGRGGRWAAIIALGCELGARRQWS